MDSQIAIVVDLKRNFSKKANVIFLKDFKSNQIKPQKKEILFIISPQSYWALKQENIFIKNITYKVIIIGNEDDLKNINPLDPEVLDIRRHELSETEFRFVLLKMKTSIKKLTIKNDSRSTNLHAMLDTQRDQETLIEIGRSLSLIKDQNILLRSILLQSKKITGADAGSIFLVEKDSKDKKMLRFKYSDTFSMNLSYEEFTIPFNTNSIAGYVAVTGNILNLKDVYCLPKDAPVSFNSSFDKTNKYRTKSMLVVPMRNHVDEIIGVIQLINSKETLGENSSGNEAFEIYLKTPEDYENLIVPFAERYEALLESIASQAAIAIENSRMIKQIEILFEEFVRASVSAIESRDPATSGHSFRVAELTLRTAKHINMITEGPLKNWNFTPDKLKELEYAALLHDFGKVYIDKSIFLKEKKLFPKDLENLLLRIGLIYRTEETKGKNEISKKLEKLNKIRQEVIELNEPKIQEQQDKTMNSLESLSKEYCCKDPFENDIPLLTKNDLINLKIKKGSLNEEEREEIKSHVTRTFDFISKIPWPESFQNVPKIAAAHHEALDGSGYPKGLEGNQIPKGAQIMAIADVYDALAAADRPYKKALPPDLVAKILLEEAEHGKLNKDIVDIFLNNKIYQQQ